jgi:hypothetical protein
MGIGSVRPGVTADTPGHARADERPAGGMTGSRTRMRLPAADFRTASAFAAAAIASRRSWSGLCLDRAARFAIRSGVGRARPVSTPSAEAAWLGVVVQRAATSSPTLSASRPPFPIGRLNI